MRQFFLHLICLSLIYSICHILLEKNSSIQRVLKLAYGIAVAFAVLSPMMQVLPLSFSLPEIHEESGRIQAQAAEIRDAAISEGIIRQTRAYILDKAAGLGLAPEVTVCLSDDNPPVPESILLQGSASPGDQAALTQILSTALGIAKEKIHWTQSNPVSGTS